MIKYYTLTASLLLLASCTTHVQTDPARTATEELLISSAADRAAAKLAIDMPQNSNVFVDNGNLEGTDSKYAIASIRSHLLQEGMRLVDDKKKADVIVETRAGALSTDRNTFMIGIPGFSVPIPLTSGSLPFPEIALYGKQEDNGVAKFAITGYSAKDGTLIAAQEPQLGFSHNTKRTILIFFSTTEKDFLPEGVDESDTDTKPAGKHSKTSLEFNNDGYSGTAASTPATTTAATSSATTTPFKIPGISR